MSEPLFNRTVKKVFVPDDTSEPASPASSENAESRPDADAASPVSASATPTPSALRENDNELGQRKVKKVYFSPDMDFRDLKAGENKPAKDAEPPVSAPATPAPSALRENDNELGQRKVKKVYVSPDELEPALPEESLQLAKKAEADEILKESFAFPWISKVLRAAILLTASVAMFFIVTQTASFLASVRMLSLTEIIPLSFLLVISGGIIFVYIMRMLSLFWRLRVSPQIRIKALHELAQRNHLRELSIEASQNAVVELCKLLEDEKTYASKDYPDTLRKLSVSEEMIRELEKNRLRLIEDAKSMPGTSREWLDDFKRRFQNHLDDIAKARIQNYYFHAALMTGVSPYPLIDRLIVLQASLAMLKELLEIYALKPSWDKNLILLAKVIINIFLAGVIDDAAENTVAWFADTISKLRDENSILSTPKGKFAVKVAGKAAGMFAQAFFVRRLGIAAMKMLRPAQIN